MSSFSLSSGGEPAIQRQRDAGNEFRIVVFQALMARDIADGVERRSAYFARALCDVVGHGENLLGVLVQQQVVITKVAPTHVPVEILRLHIKCEHICQQLAEGSRNLGNAIMAEIGWSL